MKREDLTQERLKELLDYDPVTGVFTRKTQINRHAEGSLADKRGFRSIVLDHQIYAFSYLAWFWVHGRWPDSDKQIDHINVNPRDNRIANLREATQNENLRNRKLQKNNTSGFKGVSYLPWKRTNPWWARIKANGRYLNLGYFATAEEAHQAYCAAAIEHHGEFARFG